MSKGLRGFLIAVSILCIVVGAGCVALSSKMTPADVNKKAVKYAIDSGVADVNDFLAWWPNLEVALKLDKALDAAYEINVQKLKQELEREDLKYSIHKDAVLKDVKSGQAREDLLFGEKGLLTLGLSMAGFGTLTGFVGLARKRPGDVTSQELGLAVDQAIGKTNGDLTEKEKQLVEVVKGVQKFMDTYRDTTDNKEVVMINTLKELCSKAQDTNTQVAIATIKKQQLV
jgi:hypothetical protein